MDRLSGYPRAALPRPVPTLYSYGEVAIEDTRGGRMSVPVLAMIADQQAAPFDCDCRTGYQTDIIEVGANS